MIQSGFIAVIDLGTSKITGIIGRKNEDNVISILASETIPSNRCIRRGLVYNIEETGAKVRKLINLLENKLSSKIGKVYVSVSGQSLHAITHTVRKQLSSSGIVTENVIDQMRKEAERFMPEMSKRYDIADVEYIINEKAEPQPVGVATTQIEANYQMIVGRPNIITNIEKSINGKAKLEIAGYVVGPIASAEISLNENEKELGCAFIEFGAGTTSLSIYKGGKLRYMVVIPFGGATITRDICDLNFIESDAELYKVKFGKTHETRETGFFNSFASKPDIDLSTLNHVIEMRLQEIIENIAAQIKLSGYEDQLGAGLVITGGASQLKNLHLFLEEKLGMPVRKTSAKKTFIHNSPDLANDPALTQALGLLLFGWENCEEQVVEEERAVEEKIPEPRGAKKSKNATKMRAGGFFTKVENMFGGMFDDEDDES
ncbi:MAG TPA: cell division protein FtsA [Dysgonamonadaceae bacterium]|nr:cell division protein FtsA [Dysgonamonadaceae bacterium]